MKFDLSGWWEIEKLNQEKANKLREELSGCEVVRRENQSAPILTFQQQIVLPQTTEMAGICFEQSNEEPNSLYLHRKYPIKGCVAYRRKFILAEESSQEQGQGLYLTLERTKFTNVWVDGVWVSQSHELLIPQHHALPQLSRGEHELLIVVDNELEAYEDFPTELYHGHQLTEHTQTNWNGILGEILLQEEILQKPGRRKGDGLCQKENYLYQNGQRIWLRGNVDCAIYPATGAPPMTKEEWIAIFRIYLEYGMNHVRFHSWCPPEAAFLAADDLAIYLQVELSAFATSLYLPNEVLYDERLSQYFLEQGAKVIKEYGHHSSFVLFAIGNELTGNPAAYANILKQLKKIQPQILYTQGANNFLEDPICSEEDQVFITMRTKRGKNIRGSFSHHDLPLGRLQTKEIVSTDWDYKLAARESALPLIAHEVGQYQICPNLLEAKKYCGPLYSDAIPTYQKKLEKRGMLSKAEDFFYASGKLTVALYKAELEALLRTNEISGFQLLGLQDFTGQGTALVGVLDSFLESKELITPEEWREFCNDTVVLAKLPKVVYEEGEKIPVEVLLYHYGKEVVRGKLRIFLEEEECEKTITKLEKEETTKYLKEEETAKLFKKEETTKHSKVEEIEKHSKVEENTEYSKKETVLVEKNEEWCCMPGTLTSFGKFSLDTKTFHGPKKLRLTISFENYQNHYPLFLFQKEVVMETNSILICHEFTMKEEEYLKEGGTVLYLKREKESIPGFYPTDFWCYPMFAELCKVAKEETAPGTMGLLINALHPVFQAFPTDYYTSWQWQSILKYANGLIVEESMESPIVQVIDNFDRCQRIALLYEEKVGKGHLMVCGVDLIAHLDDLVIRQFYASILSYLKTV